MIAVKMVVRIVYFVINRILLRFNAISFAHCLVQLRKTQSNLLKVVGDVKLLCQSKLTMKQ